MHAQTSTRNPARSEQQRKASHPIYLNEGLSSKKTALIIVTVVGCIAILWPKVFYPMMFGGSAVASTKGGNIKEPHRGPGGKFCIFNFIFVFPKINIYGIGGGFGKVSKNLFDHFNL